ncbi:Molybdopterin molybdenumtransferase (EC [Olavius algarvensis associated proteobacterium Delta 3]|nr:Molybdopterin molybdenumtransferase (EC [Olavius algarvensis associated proteobacterium Delta 3]CAB5133289.1 Molybdopterin molybdenumtransferase (EC [Olavius algarvensis associated proteobacterium Delta 3]
MFKTVTIDNAVGLVLAHDITEIRKGEFKGRAFKKGHRVRQADICHLQRLGKQHLYVLDLKDGWLHENDAVVAMAGAFCGPGIRWHGGPKEGKLNLVAEIDGLFKVAVAPLTEVNTLGDVMCATRHTNTLVRKGDVVAGTRAIPLVIQADIVEKAVSIARSRQGLIQVKPLRRARAGIVITGNEVFTRLIEDRFEEVLRHKIDRIGSGVIGVAFAPDDPAMIAGEIQSLISSGADLILTTGGMSVDPDDVTCEGIRKAGGHAESYGAPVLPGAMFMTAEIGGVPVLGVPACGLYHETTILDLVLPRILAGETVTRRELAGMGHGGLCLNCDNCRFPICPFGK